MRVAVVVLHYRNWPGIRRTLDAVLDQGVDPSDVTIVDNASGDGSVREIATHYSSMNVIELEANNGYATGMNAGLRSRASSHDAALLITHDCVLGDGALGVLTSRLEADERVGAVGPLLAWRSDPERVFSGGGTLVAPHYDPDHLWWREEVVSHAAEPPWAVHWLDGACVLLRTSVFRSLGGFDEDYFLYFEEVDYLARVRRAGWRVECVPMALAWQEPASSLPGALWVRNRLRFLWRNAPYSAVTRQFIRDVRNVMKRAVSQSAGERRRGLPRGPRSASARAPDVPVAPLRAQRAQASWGGLVSPVNTGGCWHLDAGRISTTQVVLIQWMDGQCDAPDDRARRHLRDVCARSPTSVASPRPIQRVCTMKTGLDVACIKADFPILKRQVHSKRLVYLDSAATSQKPIAVLEAMDRYYSEYNANVHRGVYTIAEEATAAFEAARAKVAAFVNAKHAREVIYVRNATEAINLVAYSWARANLHEGDPIVLTHMEHHANVVPWQILAAERGVEIRWIPLNADFRLDLSDLDRLLHGAKLVAFTAMSNVLGTINDVRPLADVAHASGAHVLVDACQAVPHLPVDLQAWDADFVAFSAHKMCGPTGIGALWARADLLESMPPFMGGGEMITNVTVEGFTPNEVPWKFEAGTPPIAEAVGFGAAVDYLSALGMDAVREHERSLTAYVLAALTERFGTNLTIYGPLDVDVRGGAISLLFDGIHADDISQVVDEEAVCVRAGHHCAKPLMRVLGVPATTRGSFYIYNDEADVDALVGALSRAEQFFAF